MNLSCEQIARVCFEANRAYCMSIGDFSFGTWDLAPVWQKDSLMEGVRNAIADPDLTPEQSHEKWMAEKLAKGWKYGPEKRPEALEHPCIQAYDKLPAVQRVKDVLFLAIVRALVPPQARREDDTPVANEILTDKGEVVHDGEIVQDVKQGKKKRGA